MIQVAQQTLVRKYHSNIKELDRALLQSTPGIYPLGSGSYGKIYLGTYRGKTVAIKELKEGKKTARDLKLDAIKEAEIIQ